MADVPPPFCGAGRIVVDNRASLISVGTERSLIQLGKKGLVGKARQRPDLVRRFVEKAKQEAKIRKLVVALPPPLCPPPSPPRPPPFPPPTPPLLLSSSVHPKTGPSTAFPPSPPIFRKLPPQYIYKIR